jgi:hypothetical protein
MANEVGNEQDTEVTEFLRQRTMFFAKAGECIIEYQKSEDHLEDLFAAALGVAPEKATRVFAVVRGLEARLEAVTAALSDADAQTIRRWDELKKRVGQAAESRNQIAHSTPVSTSDPIMLRIGASSDDPVTVSGGGNSRTELHKKTRTGRIAWTEQRLREETSRNASLFAALVAFSLQLRGEPVPAHLQGL